MLNKFDLVKTDSKFVNVWDKFGRLEVVAVGQVPNTYRYMAVCKCACGSNLKVIRSDSLVMGKVESCGCLQKEKTTTHGMTNSGQYGRWRHMMSRCYNLADKSFKNYGGRGIAVCERWHKVENFVADMADSYSKGCEIDRINNDGNYEPSNCRWATKQQNCDNRRTGRMLTYNGITQSITAWAKQLGINSATLWERLEVWNWTVEKTLTTKPMTSTERMKKAHETRWAGHVKAPKKITQSKPIRQVELNGKLVTVADLHELTGISKTLLRKRLYERNWPVEKAIIK